MTISIVNKSGHPLPSYQTSGSAGMDLYASLTEDMILQPGERVLVPTGLYLAIPQGFEAQIRPRSGMAVKKGITCLNTPGTIDSDYRGEIKVILINLSGEPQMISNGERIAQMVIARYENCIWSECQELEATERGQGGFGSTG